MWQRLAPTIFYKENTMKKAKDDILQSSQTFPVGHAAHPDGKTIERRIDKEGVETIDHIDRKGKKTKIK